MTTAKPKFWYLEQVQAEYAKQGIQLEEGDMRIPPEEMAKTLAPKLRVVKGGKQ